MAKMKDDDCLLVGREGVDYRVSYKDFAAEVGAGGSTGPVDWGDVNGKPSEFPPEAHTHPEPNDGKLTIQGSEGTVYGEFTANQAGDVVVTIPEDESDCPKLVSNYFIDANKSGLWAGSGKICGDDVQKNMTLLIDNVDAIDELECGDKIKVQMNDGSFHEAPIIALRKASYADGWVPFADYGWIEIDGLTEEAIRNDGTPNGSKNPYIDVNGHHTITECAASGGSAIGDGELTLKKPDGTVLGTFTANQAHPTEIIIESGGGVSDAYTKAESDARFMPLDITTLPQYRP